MKFEKFVSQNMAFLVGVVGVCYVMFQFIKTGQLNTALLTTFGGLAGFQSFLQKGGPDEIVPAA